MIEISKQYYSYGLSVLPVGKDKLPTIPKWKNRQYELIEPGAEFESANGIAIVCGGISGDLACIDIDLKYDVSGTLWKRYKALISESDPTLLKRLLIEKSPSGGFHFVYRCEAPETNRKLAQRFTTDEEKVNNPKEKVKVLIETRGEGGYFVCAPSAGYELKQGSFAEIPVLTVDERNTLIDCAIVLNEVFEVHKPKVHKQLPQNEGVPPLTDYNQRGDILEVLTAEGWTIVSENSINYFLKRPGTSTSRWSASLRKEDNLFYVFSTSTEFESDKAYPPASVYGTLKHNSDWSATAKDLYSQGYGERKQKTELAVIAPQEQIAPKIEEPIFVKMFKESFIDVNKKIDYPPVAISIGDHKMGDHVYPTSFGTYGNFSCIVGASKSKKTFFKSLLVSAYIGGQADRLSGSIRGHRKGGEFVIDIDTEQGEWHAQNVFKRIPRIVGGNPDFYKPFALRKYSHIERIQFIEYLIYESEYKDNTGLFVIDGLADLVADFNDLKESNAIIQRVMKWTQDKLFHLITIIHQNSTTNKATGHLGSSILKKAETVCNLANVDGTVEVTFPYTRGFPIDDINFEINEQGLPFVVGNGRMIPDSKSANEDPF